jgi:hypothetical protein
LSGDGVFGIVGDDLGEGDKEFGAALIGELEEAGLCSRTHYVIVDI